LHILLKMLHDLSTAKRSGHNLTGWMLLFNFLRQSVNVVDFFFQIDGSERKSGIL
jgi:hypothetical protein